MNRRVTRPAFEPLRDLKYLFNLRIGFHFLTELRYLFKCLADAHVATTDRRRNQLGYSVDSGLGDFEVPSDTLDCGVRGERSAGDDLADRIAAVETGHVIDDVAAAADTEVDIAVGHADAAR